MASVPDEAVFAAAEVSHAAFKLYVCLCAHRNRMSGESFPGHKVISQYTGIDYTYIGRLKQELADKGWLALYGKSALLVKGFGVEIWPISLNGSKSKAAKTLNESKSAPPPARTKSLNDSKLGLNDSKSTLNSSKASLNGSKSHIRNIEPVELTSRTNQLKEPDTAIAGARGRAHEHPDEFWRELHGLEKHLREAIGPYKDTKAQSSALLWLLEQGYSGDELRNCLANLSETWTYGRLSWLSVQQHIASWKVRESRAGPNELSDVERHNRAVGNQWVEGRK